MRWFRSACQADGAKRVLLALFLLMNGVLASRLWNLTFGIGSVDVRLGFNHLFILLTGIWLGPWWGALVGASADILGFLFQPHGIIGPYLPQITVVMAAWGVLPALLFRMTDSSVTFRSLVVVIGVPQLILGLGAIPLILHQAFGVPIGTSLQARALSQALAIPIYVIIAYVVLKNRQLGELVTRERDFLKLLLSSTTSVLYVTKIVSVDPPVVFPSYTSENLKQILGYEANEFVGKPDALVSCLHPEDRERFFRGAETLLTKGSLSHDYRFRHKDGGYRWLHDQSKLIRDGQGQPVELVGSWIDITERKEAEEAIRFMSFHDQLTGVYNRRFFEEELRRLDTPRNLPLTLVMLDVDGLKLVNDAFGHRAGDELLQTVTKTVTACCRADEVIARLGGDEFVILLPGTDEAGASRLQMRIQAAMNEMSVAHVPVSVSCGLATKVDPQEPMEALLKAAEDRLYKNKISHRTTKRWAAVEQLVKSLFAQRPQEELHATGTGELATALGQAMGLPTADIQSLKDAGRLHDIGKIAIDQRIFDKAGPLSDTERLTMQRHPEIGYSILSEVNDYSPLAEVIIAHHERWDGTGYPKGLQGEDSPLLARILSVADAYDAMTRQRPYRPLVGHADAVKEIAACSGSQFDPKIVDALLHMDLGITLQATKS